MQMREYRFCSITDHSTSFQLVVSKCTEVSCENDRTILSCPMVFQKAWGADTEHEGFM